MRGSIREGQRLALFSNRWDLPRARVSGPCLPVDLLLLLDYACNLVWHSENSHGLCRFTCKCTHGALHTIFFQTRAKARDDINEEALRSVRNAKQ